MSRPGFVLSVDAQTPPLVVFQGEKVLLERLPAGASVLYPPDALPGIRSVEAQIDRALAKPVDSEPLAALLHPETRVTIVFDDLSQPLTARTAPDVRQRVIERVLELAAVAGVDDVELIAATGLRRRLTAQDLRAVLGDRVFASFSPDRLRSHDSEATNDLVEVGRTADGTPIEINSRVVSSDLVISVRLASAVGNEGAPAVVTKLASAATARALNSPLAVAPGSADAYGALVDQIGDTAKVFTIDVTLSPEPTGPGTAFLSKREREWSLTDRALSTGLQAATRLLPSRKRVGLSQISGIGFGVTSVVAGRPSSVHPLTEAFLTQQQVGQVAAPADVALFGIPNPGGIGTTLNPVTAAALGLGQVFNGSTSAPVVRKGGTAIFYHPLANWFHPLYHPAYVDFFAEALATTTDSGRLSAEFEGKFASDPWYRHLYQTSFAHHALHPFHAWYSAAPAIEHLGDVIFVGGNLESTRRMGFKAATTLNDALEMASDSVGLSPSITYVHGAPVSISEVS
ncbi:nickel-dependent lactate racemase [Subtercola sp. PAMC28395]|uniref:lactate racemase domain-containing protein n=1 Tax=Subtercola sp. PAMC28395 TaxID=2846775 RepID=UPI001C0C6145|nr:lactate racemase domain-containing protein [Subtercola sp. PAMC28395]QWT24362.1 nickel-dependent lactate racemase [Subtercola sp. PAMC28395]